MFSDQFVAGDLRKLLQKDTAFHKYCSDLISISHFATFVKKHYLKKIRIYMLRCIVWLGLALFNQADK